MWLRISKAKPERKMNFSLALKCGHSRTSHSLAVLLGWLGTQREVNWSCLCCAHKWPISVGAEQCRGCPVASEFVLLFAF